LFVTSVQPKGKHGSGDQKIQGADGLTSAFQSDA
jgi:hypothetical protein